MLPYPSAAVAMDYAAGYQRQGHNVTGPPMGMGALGMSVGGPSFTHSWLVPTQDLCAVPYKQLPNQHQNPMMHSNQQLIEPGILELRKEKSRDAARSRRGKENYEFYELAKMLPLPAAITSQLDKASIIRLTISYLKLRDFSGHGDPPWSRENLTGNKVLKSATSRRTPAGLALEMFEQHQGTHILQSLDGFALAVAADGRFLYISETVSIYLGLSQVEMTGSSIFDYVHHADHAEMAEQLGLSLTRQGGISSPASGGSEEGGNHGTNNPDVSASMALSDSNSYKGLDRAFCIRMKSTLTKRGCHFKSSGYRVSEDDKSTQFGGKHGKTSANHYSVVLLICRLRPQYTFSHNRKNQPPLLGMVALAIALPPPSVHEIRLESDMFVTRINFDLTIAHCEPKITDLLDYTAEEFTGKSLYALCHGEDADKLRKCHLDLINKGQVLTHYYRIMNKNGGYTWIQTCATVVCSSKNADEQNIICVNYVISGRECENIILDCCQMETVKLEDSCGNSIPNENSTRSPGGDPSNDGSQGPSNRPNENHTSPKTETPEPRSRTRNNTTTNSSTTNNNNTSANLSSEITASIVHSVATEVPTPPTPVVTVTGSTRGRKRKLKPEIDAIEAHAAQNPPPAPIQLNENNAAIDHHHSQRHGNDERSESSVKDLEHAMSKHLPLSANINNTTTDFSADALLKQQQQQQQQQEKGSTIQWIGHNPHFHQQPATMPATALLRQLYANRESVIRATTRPTPSGVFYTDSNQNGPLPTPPGSETSFDNQFLLHGHGQKPSDAFSNLVSSYGSYPSAMDYHSAMTPPSSVSPRDTANNSNTSKTPTTIHSSTNSAGSVGAGGGSANGGGSNNVGFDYPSDSIGRQYGGVAGIVNSADANNIPPLPLKPQPYSAAAMHHANSIDAYGSIDQSQYFSHHSGFHLYHKGATSAGWYTAPS